jgi:pilus assembly protein CpaE
MSTLVLATPSEGFEARVQHALAGAPNGHANGHHRYWREGMLHEEPGRIVDELMRNSPDVIAIGPGFAVENALELARAVDAQRPDVVVVLVAEPSIHLLERALRAGARDVIAPDADDADMRDAFVRALDAGGRRRSTMLAMESAGPSRHVTCLLSPKGGTGKTTVSTNLAIGLAQRYPGEVVIVDLDLQFGDVASALHLSPDHTIADMVRSPLSIDATALKAFLTAHRSGLYALCAPETPADADLVNPEVVQRAVTLLASEFRFVVLDTGSGLDEPTLATLGLCTDFVCLTSTDVPSVRNTRKEVETLDLLGHHAQHRHFVVNRADAKVGLTLADIEATVGMRIDVAIPSSRAVPLAVNQGEPVLVGDPRNPAAVALGVLVDRFAPVDAGARNRTGTANGNGNGAGGSGGTKWRRGAK